MELMLCFCHTATTKLSSLPLLSSNLHKKKLFSTPHAHSKVTIPHRRAAARWAAVEADIQTHLLNSLPTTPPSVVSDPMRYLVTAAPKTMAPSLCLAACELVAGTNDLALDAACALRLMHAGAWSHDCLPYLLGPPPPSGNPYRPGVLLLTGDAIVPFGYEMLARSEKVGGEIALRVILEMTEAMSAGGLKEGQWGRTRGDEAAAWVCEKTEGRLCACGAACGAMVGGGGEEVVERMRKFGLFVGTMYGLLMSGGERKAMETAAEEYRLRAEEELEGLEEGKKMAFLELVEYYWWNTTKPRPRDAADELTLK